MSEQHGADIVSSGGSDIPIDGSPATSASAQPPSMPPPPGSAPLPPGAATAPPAFAPPAPVLVPGKNPQLDRYAWYSLVAGAIGVLLPFLANHVLIVIPFFGLYNGFRALKSTKLWAAVLGLVLNGIAILLLVANFIPHS